MLRIIVGLVMVLLLAAPSILIALRWRAPSPVRVGLAAAAFTLPLVLIWAIHQNPAFDGRSPTDPAFWRGIGVLLSASTLILPWLLYGALRDRFDGGRRT